MMTRVMFGPVMHLNAAHCLLQLTAAHPHFHHHPHAHAHPHPHPHSGFVDPSPPRRHTIFGAFLGGAVFSVTHVAT